MQQNNNKHPSNINKKLSTESNEKQHLENENKNFRKFRKPPPGFERNEFWFHEINEYLNWNEIRRRIAEHQKLKEKFDLIEKERLCKVKEEKEKEKTMKQLQIYKEIMNPDIHNEQEKTVENFGGKINKQPKSKEKSTNIKSPDIKDKKQQGKEKKKEKTEKLEKNSNLSKDEKKKNCDVKNKEKNNDNNNNCDFEKTKEELLKITSNSNVYKGKRLQRIAEFLEIKLNQNESFERKLQLVTQTILEKGSLEEITLQQAKL
jgi:hypothetical protein